MEDENWIRQLIRNQQAMAGILSALIIGLFGLTAALVNRPRVFPSSLTPPPTLLPGASGPPVSQPILTMPPTVAPSPTPAAVALQPTASSSRAHRSALPTPQPSATATPTALAGAPVPPVSNPPASLTLSPDQTVHLPANTWWGCTGHLTLTMADGTSQSLADPSATTGLLLMAAPNQNLSVMSADAGRCDPAPASPDARTAWINARISDMLSWDCGGGKGCQRVKVVEQGGLQTTYWVSK